MSQLHRDMGGRAQTFAARALLLNAPNTQHPSHAGCPILAALFAARVGKHRPSLPVHSPHRAEYSSLVTLSERSQRNRLCFLRRMLNYDVEGRTAEDDHSQGRDCCSEIQSEPLRRSVCDKDVLAAEIGASGDIQQCCCHVRCGDASVMWRHVHITEPIVASWGITADVRRPNLRPVDSTLPEHMFHAPHVVVGGAKQMLKNWQKNDLGEQWLVRPNIGSLRRDNNKALDFVSCHSGDDRACTLRIDRRWDSRRSDSHGVNYCIYPIQKGYDGTLLQNIYGSFSQMLALETESFRGP